MEPLTIILTILLAILLAPMLFVLGIILAFIPLVILGLCIGSLDVEINKKEMESVSRQ